MESAVLQIETDPGSFPGVPQLCFPGGNPTPVFGKKSGCAKSVCRFLSPSRGRCGFLRLLEQFVCRGKVPFAELAFGYVENIGFDRGPERHDFHALEIQGAFLEREGAGAGPARNRAGPAGIGVVQDLFALYAHFQGRPVGFGGENHIDFPALARRWVFNARFRKGLFIVSAVERDVGVPARKKGEDVTVAESRIVQRHQNDGSGCRIDDPQFRQHPQIRRCDPFPEKHPDRNRPREHPQSFPRFLDVALRLILRKFMLMVQKKFPAVQNIGVEKRVLIFQFPFPVVFPADAAFQTGERLFRRNARLFGAPVDLFAEHDRIDVKRQKQKNDRNGQKNGGDHVDPDPVPFQPEQKTGRYAGVFRNRGKAALVGDDIVLQRSHTLIPPLRIPRHRPENDELQRGGGEPFSRRGGMMFPVRTLRRISSMLSPRNGGWRVRIVYRMAPSA